MSAGGHGSQAASGSPALQPDERARRRAGLVDVLWRLQEERGWIDDEAVRRAAAECALTPSEVDEVATFYNLIHRRPAGRKRIYVCDSISCELNGAPQLLEALSAALGIAPGEVTDDGAFALLPIVCLGHCDRAPCLMAGDTIHGPCSLDRESVRRLVEELRHE